MHLLTSPLDSWLPLLESWPFWDLKHPSFQTMRQAQEHSNGPRVLLFDCRSLGTLATPTGVMASPMASNLQATPTGVMAHGTMATPTGVMSTPTGVLATPTGVMASPMVTPTGVMAASSLRWQAPWNTGHPNRSHGQPHGFQPAGHPNRSHGPWSTDQPKRSLGHPNRSQSKPQQESWSPQQESKPPQQGSWPGPWPPQ